MFNAQLRRYFTYSCPDLLGMLVFYHVAKCQWNNKSFSFKLK